MNSFLLVDTLDKLKDLASIWESKEFAFDTEFTSLSFKKQKIIGMSLYDHRQTIDPVFIQFNFDYIYTEKEKDPKGGRAIRS